VIQLNRHDKRIGIPAPGGSSFFIAPGFASSIMLALVHHIVKIFQIPWSIGEPGDMMHNNPEQILVDVTPDGNAGQTFFWSHERI